MFVTHPPYEFHVPAGLAPPNSSHWRLVEFHLQLPWFIVSVLRKDPFSEASRVQAYFIAWEKDLVSFLSEAGASPVASVVCMAPKRQSSVGCWEAHEVTEVWAIDAADEATYLELVGADGSVLDVGLMSAPPRVSQRRERLLEIAPIRPRRSQRPAANWRPIRK